MPVPNELAFSRRRRGARAASAPEAGVNALVEQTRAGRLLGDFRHATVKDRGRAGGIGDEDGRNQG